MSGIAAALLTQSCRLSGQEFLIDISVPTGPSLGYGYMCSISCKLSIKLIYLQIIIGSFKVGQS